MLTHTLTGQHCQDKPLEQSWPVSQVLEEALVLYISGNKCMCCSLIGVKGIFHICYISETEF